MPGAIALLTDFGLADPFVGIMKGVILARYPKAHIVDLTHGVSPQDIRAGAFHLMTAAPYFPKGTIFVCVVDPGVGSGRRILWARSGRHQFLAPDNGLLGWAERVGKFAEVREVSNRRLFLQPVSSTFHGRDIFAPLAAYLAQGGSPAGLGPRVRSWKRLPFPEPRRAGKMFRGELLAIDRFGNAVTNIAMDDIGAGPAAAIGAEDCPSPRGRSAGFYQDCRGELRGERDIGFSRKSGIEFRFKRRSIGMLRAHYAEGAPGRPLAVAGSSGFVELCVREGSFAEKFGARVGDPVEAKHGA